MRTAIYIRTVNSNGYWNCAVEQLDVCLTHADYHFKTTQNVKIYVELDNQNRSELAKLLSDARDGKIKNLLVADTARLSRDTKTLALLLAEFNLHGVAVIDVSIGMCVSDEDTRMLFETKALLNQQYIRDLRTRITHGQHQLISQKEPIGKLGYGYRKRRGKRKSCTVIRINEASAIQRIFVEYGLGTSVEDIIKDLNADGIKPISGKKWNASQITKVLSNEKYIGRFTWGRTKSVKDPRTGQYRQVKRPASEWVTEYIPKLRIVSDELWSVASERLKNRR